MHPWPEYWRSDPSDPADLDSVAEWIAVNRPEAEEIRRALHALCEHLTDDDLWMVQLTHRRSL